MDTDQRPATIPEPLDYARSGTAPARSSAGTAHSYYATELLAILLPCGIIITVVLLFLVPPFELTFRDFGTELPGITDALLRMSRSFREIYGLALFWMLLLAVPVIAAPAFNRSRRARTIIWVAIAACFLLFLPFTVLGLFAPMWNLINAVSGK